VTGVQERGMKLTCDRWCCLYVELCVNVPDGLHTVVIPMVHLCMHLLAVAPVGIESTTFSS
jgi:hypothetical protein